MKKLLCLLFALMAVWTAVTAQQYPVQVNAQLAPPYSLIVSDYYSTAVSGTEKLKVILLNKDLQRASLQVRLRLIMESQSVRIRTREDVAFTPITLVSGTPYYVSPADLQQYFRPENLEFSGISQGEYEQSGKLPEGFYSFCLEAVEVQGGQTVSNRSCAFAWMTLSDPPFLNLPLKGESITPRNPQNIVFHWTPRHTASVNASFSTDYIFSIAEIQDSTVAPEAAFTTNAVLYSQNVGSVTTFLYDAAKPQLVPGKRYAWRVQAVGKSGGVGLAAFKNSGYSETWWFTYQSTCTAPLGVSATLQGQNVVVSWQTNPQHREYRLEYREKNNGEAEWFSKTNTLPSITLTDLKAATQYEYRVGGSCDEGVYTFGDLLSFTTNGENVSVVPNCGDSSLIPATVQQNLLQTLLPGDSIKAGDFTVIVTECSGSASFTGKGYVKVPWLMNMKVAVQFNGIGVNTDKRLVIGRIETPYDPNEGGIGDVDEYIDAYVGGNEVGRVISGLPSAEEAVSFLVQMPGGIQASFGAGYNSSTGQGPVTLTLTPAGGGTSQTITTDHLPTTIQDSGGNIYQVDKNGGVSSIGKAGGDALLTKTNKSHVDTDKGVVKFVDYPGRQVYAFDEWRSEYKKSGAFNKKYERLNDDYYVSAKAIAPGKTDYLKAVVALKDNTLSADSIQFVSGKGTIYERTKKADGVYEIAVVGGPEKDAQEIYALYKQGGGKTLNLGKVLVASYPIQKRKLVLIPVNGISINRDSVSAILNNTYNNVCVEWEVNQDQSFDFMGWDLDGDKRLKLDGTGFWSTQTDEMKALNNAFSGSRKVDPGTIYLFVLDQAAESGNNTIILGEMPRGKQFGYLFVKSADIHSVGITAAHEVGHGVFNLKHVFEYDGIEMGKLPSNVMDYPSGEHFAKLQWDYIHDPSMVLGIFQKEESSQNQIVVINKTFLNPDSTTVSFLTKTGSILSVKYKELNSVEFSYGSVTAPDQDIRQGLNYQFSTAEGLLHAFVIKKDGATERYVFNEQTKSYIKEGTTTNYVISIDTSKIDGFIFPMPCGADYTLYKFSKQSLPSYSPGNGSVLDFSSLGALFKPFLENLPIKKDGITITQVIAQEVYRNCLWCRDENTAALTQKYCGKPELYYIDKVAQLRVIFPEYFLQFTQKDNWENPKNESSIAVGSGLGYGSTEITKPATDWYWGAYLNSNPSLVSDFMNGTNLREYFITLCYKFRDYINEQSTAADQFWANLSSNTPVDDIVKYLQKEPLFQTSKAPLEKRKLALKLLVNGSVLEDKEDAIIKIIASVGTEEQASMLSFIASEIKIRTLFNKIDDFGGKANFTKVITLISSYIQNPTENVHAFELIAKEENPEYVSIDRDLFDNRQTGGYSIDENNNISFYNVVRKQKNPYDDPRYPAGSENQVFLTVPYDQLIPVDFWTDFELGSNVYKKKHIQRLPAIYAALLLDKANQELFSKKAWLVADGVMLVIGAGEVKILFSSVAWIRKAMVVSNLAGSVGEILTEVLPEEALSAKFRNKLRISCMLLQLPEAIRGVGEIFKCLKSTASEAASYTDDMRFGQAAREELKKFEGLVNTINEGDFVEDAAEFSRRVVSLGEGDIKNVKQWLHDINSVDNRVYVVAHSEGNQFSVITKTGEEVNISHRSLAKWIESKNFPSNQEIVLLSCSDIETAQNLSKKLGRKVVASDGSVSVFSDGGIRSEKPFMELTPDGNKVVYNGQFKVPSANATSVTMGNQWKGFFTNLDWEQSLKDALEADIIASTDLKVLFTNANNKVELAEAWKALKEANRSGLVFKPKAIEELARAANNVKLQELGLTREILASIKASRLEEGSFANILRDLDDLGNKLLENGNQTVRFENFNSLIGKLVTKNPQNSQAAQWIIQDITFNTNDFKGTTWKFEGLERNMDGNNAFIDLIGGNPPLKIEYKWLTVSTVDKETFIREFVKRDLFSGADFSKLQWRIKGNKLTRTKVLEYLSSEEGLKALSGLDLSKVRLQLDNVFITESEKAKAIIDYFSVDTNFEKIFK